MVKSVGKLTVSWWRNDVERRPTKEQNSLLHVNESLALEPSNKCWCWSFHPQQRRFKFNRIMKYSNLGKSWSWKVYIPAAMDKKDVECISWQNFFLWRCNKWSQEVELKTVWIDKFPKELADSEGLNLRIIWTRREFLRSMIFVATLLVLRK